MGGADVQEFVKRVGRKLAEVQQSWACFEWREPVARFAKCSRGAKSDACGAPRWKPGSGAACTRSDLWLCGMLRPLIPTPPIWHRPMGTQVQRGPPRARSEPRQCATCAPHCRRQCNRASAPCARSTATTLMSSRAGCCTAVASAAGRLWALWPRKEETQLSRVDTRVVAALGVAL